jgi:hypothetical protein
MSHKRDRASPATNSQPSGADESHHLNDNDEDKRWLSVVPIRRAKARGHELGALGVIRTKLLPMNNLWEMTMSVRH